MKVDQTTINAIGTVWNQSRLECVALVLISRKWAADKPLDLQVYTSLLIGKPRKLTGIGPRIVHPLVAACQDRDSRVRSAGLKYLGSHKSAPIGFVEPMCNACRDGGSAIADDIHDVLKQLETIDAREELCRLVIDKNDEDAARAAMDGKFEPRDAVRKSLFLFLTCQWDLLSSHDRNSDFLVMGYHSVESSIKKRLRQVARTSTRKQIMKAVTNNLDPDHLANMGKNEWSDVIETLCSARAWEDLWKLALEAPARWSQACIKRLVKSSWEPTGADRIACHELASRASEWNALSEQSKSMSLNSFKRLKDSFLWGFEDASYWDYVYERPSRSVTWYYLPSIVASKPARTITAEEVKWIGASLQSGVPDQDTRSALEYIVILATWWMRDVEVADRVSNASSTEIELKAKV